MKKKYQIIQILTVLLIGGLGRQGVAATQNAELIARLQGCANLYAHIGASDFVDQNKIDDIHKSVGAQVNDYSHYAILDTSIKADYEQCLGISLTGNLDAAKISAITEEMHVGDTNCYNPAFHDAAIPHDGTIAPLLKIFWWSGKMTPQTPQNFPIHIDQLGRANYGLNIVFDADEKGIYLGFDYSEGSVVRDLNRDQQKEFNFGIVKNKALQCQNAANQLSAATSPAVGGTIHFPLHPIQINPPSDSEGGSTAPGNSGGNDSAANGATDEETGGSIATSGESQIVSGSDASDTIDANGPAAEGSSGCSLQKGTLSSNPDTWGCLLLVVTALLWSRRGDFKRK